MTRTNYHSQRMYLRRPSVCPAPLTSPDRTKRVKDARNEAQKEIDEYKQQKEDEFKKFESQVCSAPERLTQARHRGQANVPTARQWEQEGRRGRQQGRRSQGEGDRRGGQEDGR